MGGAGPVCGAGEVYAFEVAPDAERREVIGRLAAAVGAETDMMRGAIAARAEGVGAAEAVARVDVGVGDGRELADPGLDEVEAGEVEEAHRARAMTEVEAFDAAVQGADFWLDAESKGVAGE